jgi:hypothetical protein
MSEQVFSYFSSPCFGVKTVYNYGHRHAGRQKVAKVKLSIVFGFVTFM